MNNYKSTASFCAEELLTDVKHYKGDAFITYGQINEMKLDTNAVIITRECGVEFISEKTCEPLYMFNAWKSQAVRIFEVIRREDRAFRCPDVEYYEISAEIAESLVMDWEKNKFKNHWFMHRGWGEDRVYTYDEMLHRLCIDEDHAFNVLSDLTKSGCEFYLINPMTDAR